MITVDWGNRGQTFLLIKITEAWTAREYQEIFSTAHRLIRRKPLIVSMLVDMQATNQFPPNIMSIVARSIGTCPSNTGQIIVMSTSNIWQKLWDAACHLHHINHSLIQFVSTADEAYALLGNTPNTDEALPT